MVLENYQIPNDNNNYNNDDDDDYVEYDCSAHGLQKCNDEVDKRLILNLTPNANDEQAELVRRLLRLHPIGLKLHPTTSFVKALERAIKAKSVIDHDGSQRNCDKLKASNFSATFLRIGSWERSTKNEGDLVAKCYYAKRKLVWEFLEMGLKQKIEIQWSDIIGMRADTQENKPGILEIELNRPPTFHVETDPEPRKHTMWRLTTDFTGGEASKWRRHYLRFPPGSLEKHYEKILQCDSRLYTLSQQPFPRLQSPIFDSNPSGIAGLSYDCIGRPLDYMNLGIQSAATFSTIPSPPLELPNNQNTQPYEINTGPFFMETPSPISGDHTSNRVVENSRVVSWAFPQVTNNAHDLQLGHQLVQAYPDHDVAMNQVEEPTLVDFPAQFTNPPIASQNYSLPTQFEAAGERGNNLLRLMSALLSTLSQIQ